MESPITPHEAVVIAKLMLHVGQWLASRELGSKFCKDTQCIKATFRKHIQNIRKKMDEKCDKTSTGCRASQKRFHMQDGSARFKPPVDEKFLLILPVNYKTEFFA